MVEIEADCIMGFNTVFTNKRTVYPGYFLEIIIVGDDNIIATNLLIIETNNQKNYRPRQVVFRRSPNYTAVNRQFTLL